jgi:hypothetical protein
MKSRNPVILNGSVHKHGHDPISYESIPWGKRIWGLFKGLHPQGNELISWLHACRWIRGWYAIQQHVQLVVNRTPRPSTETSQQCVVRKGFWYSLTEQSIETWLVTAFIQQLLTHCHQMLCRWRSQALPLCAGHSWFQLQLQNRWLRTILPFMWLPENVTYETNKIPEALFSGVKPDPCMYRSYEGRCYIYTQFWYPITTGLIHLHFLSITNIFMIIR